MDFFAKKSIETPETDAELLLAFVLKCKRLELFLNYERELSKAETDVLRRLSVRRAHREPLQY
ncbi:MAG: peptide chain release factor N(5)-glutamine methyltransferase, partial [bacterium]